MKQNNNSKGLAKQFLQDTDVNIIDVIGKEFTKAAVRTENKSIITKLKELESTTITDIDGLVDALNVGLDPAIAETAKLVTNQTSFNYLDKLKDKDGHNLLQPCLTDSTKKMFKGKIIEVFSDEELSPKVSGNLTFYIGDPEEYIDFYELKGIEIAKSDEAGFKEYTTWLRAVERYDVQISDSKAMKLCEMKNPATVL
ncbi:phage major capsid protein [Peptostreptococcus equinus]|uniref:Phage major capsid protein n=1 Tax=Peptostreptococcus equinus TaxID=3003601 RepID=A0ABY7JSR6_9FIRM|nr:phage major capsid protein [Peptostreptococcus sp. CBA3647]WAW14752.1 phage major capsid protein [Peptostreptococcus sp. CBA3647]